MKKLGTVLLLPLFCVFAACVRKKPGEMVLVEGGIYKNEKSAFFGMSIDSFYIGKYEVTQDEWRMVMGDNPSHFKGGDLPVESVSWYDCIEYCNAKSMMEGLRPCYRITEVKAAAGETTDGARRTVTINAGADGYRLPTEAEWEYAAAGGRMSRHYLYSGGHEASAVAWYWKNSGEQNLDGFWNYALIVAHRCRTRPVGGKEPNELGLYDMSGNVREWCWDRREAAGIDGVQERVWKGGCWLSGEQACETTFQGSWRADGKSADTGFRVCRSK